MSDLPNITHITNLSALTHPVLNIASLAADKTLTTQEFKDYYIIDVAASTGAYNLILPVAKGAIMYIVNRSANTVSVKRNGQATPIAIATLKTAAVYCDGTDYRRLTADA